VENWKSNWTRGQSLLDRGGVLSYTPALIATRAAAPGFAYTQSGSIGFVMRAATRVRTASGVRRVRFETFKQQGIPDPRNFIAQSHPTGRGASLLRAAIRGGTARHLPVEIELVLFTAEGPLKYRHTFVARVTP
jgi:hypothetical protein